MPQLVLKGGCRPLRLLLVPGLSARAQGYFHAREVRERLTVRERGGNGQTGAIGKVVVGDVDVGRKVGAPGKGDRGRVDQSALGKEFPRRVPDRKGKNNHFSHLYAVSLMCQILFCTAALRIKSTMCTSTSRPSATQGQALIPQPLTGFNADYVWPHL